MNIGLFVTDLEGILFGAVGSDVQGIVGVLLVDVEGEAYKAVGIGRHVWVSGKRRGSKRKQEEGLVGATPWEVGTQRGFNF
jgi:hypothetical protein